MVAQGVLDFQYEADSSRHGQTSLAGLPVYLDLVKASGLGAVELFNLATAWPQTVAISGNAAAVTLTSSATTFLSTASVTLTGTAATSDGTVSLDAGTGLSVSVPSITFPSMVAGGVSTAQAVILNNTGSVPLTLTLGVSGAAANLFPQTTSCGS